MDTLFSIFIQLIHCALVSVRYLKEITPYFKKNFQLEGVGWQLDNRRPIAKPAPSGEIKIIPLAWAVLTRAGPDTLPHMGGSESMDSFGNSTIFELKSPDHRFSVVFRSVNVTYNA